jgi:aspartate/glutamate racemase
MGKIMPSKHIDEETWRKVEKETVKAVLATQRSIKDTEVLKVLITKGLEHVTDDDYAKLRKPRKK